MYDISSIQLHAEP